MTVQMVDNEDRLTPGLFLQNKYKARLKLSLTMNLPYLVLLIGFNWNSSTRCGLPGLVVPGGL